MHPDYGLGLHNIANLYRGEGEYAKAEQLYLQSVAVQKKALSRRRAPGRSRKGIRQKPVSPCHDLPIKRGFLGGRAPLSAGVGDHKKGTWRNAPALRRKPERIGLFVL